jgi:cytoskeletal protein CcmA (bactofilin family)
VFFRRRERGLPVASEVSDPAGGTPGRGERGTVIGAQTRIQGALKGRGAVLVCGGFRGEIAVDGSLSVAPGATLEADVAVERAHVAGFVRGAMRAATSIRLESDGTIEGDLSTPIIDLRPGAVLRGRASVAGPPHDRDR